jgi:hypothetical protein
VSKDPAAVALGRKRWKGKTEEEKAAHAQLMNEKRTSKTTPEQRTEIARDAAKAMWAKRRAAAKKAPKKADK